MELVERTETSYSRPRKRSIVESLDEHGEEVFKFRILLPNGAITDLTLHGPGEEMFIDEFVDAVRIEFERSAKRTPGIKRKIMWDGDIYLEDLSENKIGKRIHFNRFKSNKLHTLRLFDGAEDTVDTFQNMWDLTPDTDLLSELPAEYTFETALADLIDNSLQAVWSNTLGDRRLVRSINSLNHLMDGLDLALICHIGTCTGVQMGVPLTFVSIANLLLVNMSVVVTDQAISIFDSGPGMDGSDEKSIVKWGKMGSSNHRSSKGLAIGGKPPYLMVEIYEPKLRCLEEFQLQCRLKDIYFPYIQECLCSEEVYEMGNCMAGDVGGDVVRIMTDSGGIIELEGPIQVRTVLIDFPGYGIFRQGNVSTPLSGHDQLLNGRLYYLLPMDMMRIGSNAEVMDESDAGSETLAGSSRFSSGRASDLLTNLTVGPALEVLPSPGNGVWKVKLVINTDQLAEILSEQSNTQALIERMRTAASMSGATPKRDKGTWSVGWRAGVSSMCKLPAEGCV